MKSDQHTQFPDDVVKKLGTYVYRLIDPRNGETFYVGKGRGNRIFQHINAERKLDGDEVDNKIQRIREIHAAGFEVLHIIHRHGMDEKTAFEVESALIDAYPGLTNISSGFGNDYGTMHAEEIIRRYSAEPAIIKHKVIMITINRTVNETSIYEATRHAWKIDKEKAKHAEFIFSVVRGMIVGVFVPEIWLEATTLNFPGREDRPGRIGFEGREADSKILKIYVGKRIPGEYRKRGAANPIRYSWGK
jgi:uncharacterized protein